MEKLKEIAVKHDLLVRGTDEPDAHALAALREVRAEALEEAAQVAEVQIGATRHEIAERIRALKEQP